MITFNSIYFYSLIKYRIDDLDLSILQLYIVLTLQFLLTNDIQRFTLRSRSLPSHLHALSHHRFLDPILFCYALQTRSPHKHQVQNDNIPQELDNICSFSRQLRNS